jgi:putative NIF3 family GTP cyclohydrolase 1 type 2
MPLTIQQAIDAIIADVPGAPFPDTVDTVKIGDPTQPLTGIAITFLASYEVIQQAAQLGANLIITHEPTFYGHLDDTDWLKEDPVYAAKRQLIEQHNLVIWRFHDYLHSIPPDATLVGLLRELEWEPYLQTDFQCRIPPMTLGQLVAHLKARLGVESMRVVGDSDLRCEYVCVLPGFIGREVQIGVLGRPEVNVVIVGEIHEWETSEYARDAVSLGQSKALIVLGHAASEEPGMRAIIPWLQERIPGVPITFVPTGRLLRSA